MSTEFKARTSYPGAAFNPIGGDLLGEPEDREQHLELWADALFENNQVPSSMGGFYEGDDARHRQGLRVCKECGASVMVWCEYDEASLNRHRAYHDKLYEAVQLTAEIRYEREESAEMDRRT